MILVTGCDSTAGRTLVSELVSKNHKVRCHFIDSPKKVPEGCESITGMLSNKRELENALKDVDTLVHFLEISHSDNTGRKYMKRINIELSQRLLKAAAEAGVTHAIIRSSWQVYGHSVKTPLTEDRALNPITQFGKDKRILETYCKTKKFPSMKISIIRPALPVGPDTDNTAILLMMYLALAQDRENRAHIISGGKNSFELIDYSDLAKAVSLIIEKKAEGVFNLSGGGAPTTETIMEIFKKFEPSVHILNFSRIKANYLSFFMGLVKSHHLTGDHMMMLRKNVILDTSAAKNALGWNPEYDTLSAFERMIKWYKKEKMKSSV